MNSLAAAPGCGFVRRNDYVMIVPPRGLVNFAAELLSARTARRLSKVDSGHAAQRSALAGLTAGVVTFNFIAGSSAVAKSPTSAA